MVFARVVPQEVHPLQLDGLRDGRTASYAEGKKEASERALTRAKQELQALKLNDFATCAQVPSRWTENPPTLYLPLSRLQLNFGTR